VESLKWGVCVCVATGGMGVFIGSIGRFLHVGSGDWVKVDGQAGAILALPCTTSMIPKYSSSLPPFTLPPSLRRFFGKVGLHGDPLGPLGWVMAHALLWSCGGPWWHDSWYLIYNSPFYP
jgi:hypothetical protein